MTSLQVSSASAARTEHSVTPDKLSSAVTQMSNPVMQACAPACGTWQLSLHRSEKRQVVIDPIVPLAPTFTLPIAKVRSVYQTADVERKLGKLQNGDSRKHDSLRSTYERMLERGPERFQMKPSGPKWRHFYDALPNFADVLDDVRRHVALSQDSTDGLEVMSMLLLGMPVSARRISPDRWPSWSAPA